MPTHADSNTQMLLTDYTFDERTLSANRVQNSFFFLLTNGK